MIEDDVFAFQSQRLNLSRHFGQIGMVSDDP